jgi:hypothetical protein
MEGSGRWPFQGSQKRIDILKENPNTNLFIFVKKGWKK